MTAFTLAGAARLIEAHTISSTGPSGAGVLPTVPQGAGQDYGHHQRDLCSSVKAMT
jgi:hypothetical protein